MIYGERFYEKRLGKKAKNKLDFTPEIFFKIAVLKIIGNFKISKESTCVLQNRCS